MGMAGGNSSRLWPIFPLHNIFHSLAATPRLLVLVSSMQGEEPSTALRPEHILLLLPALPCSAAGITQHSCASASLRSLGLFPGQRAGLHSCAPRAAGTQDTAGKHTGDRFRGWGAGWGNVWGARMMAGKKKI